MRIFNEDKTQELNAQELDFEQGYLKKDKRVTVHHDAIPFQKGKTAAQIAEELKAQGIGIEIGFDGNPYKILQAEKGGGFVVEPIAAQSDAPAQEAWDEYEDIQVYVPYTEEELTAQKRGRRVPLLEAFDKWEKAVLRGREADDADVMEWYLELLDLEDNAFENVPERVRYYL